MKKYEPWAVAAVYLMQSASGKEHYTDIVNYILNTELTELTEKGVATSRTVTQKLNQTVINGRAIFNTDGNGYYLLNGKGVIRENEDIQGVIQSLNDKGMKVNLPARKVKEEEPAKQDEILDSQDDRLSDEARRLSEEARKLSDQTRRLSDETVKLSDENKKLREEVKILREKTRLLSNENEELNNEAGKLRESNQQFKEKLRSIRQLCDTL